MWGRLHLGRRTFGAGHFSPRSLRAALVALCGLILSVCVCAWLARGDATRTVPCHLATFGAAFVAYLVALGAARGLRPGHLRLALALAVVWRLLLVGTPAMLSDDVYRYVWEGRVQAYGGNPYAFADRPAAPRWIGLRDQVWQGVNWKEYTAIYPPLWQLVARGVVAVHASPGAMKLALVGCELLAWWPLLWLLQRRRLPAERLLVLAWSPLALVEIAGSGHNEALGLALVAWALLALDTGRSLLAALLAALAFQAKLVPGLFAAAWGRRFRPRDVVAGSALAGLLALPFLSAGAQVFGSLAAYARLWTFNETGFALLLGLSPDRPAALRAALVLLGALALYGAVRRVEPVRAGLLMTVAWLLLMPAVFPWYVLWALPFLVLLDAPAVLLFTGTVALAYLVYPSWLSGAVWQVSWGVRALEYLPCLIVAVWDGVRRRGWPHAALSTEASET